VAERAVLFAVRVNPRALPFVLLTFLACGGSGGSLFGDGTGGGGNASGGGGDPGSFSTDPVGTNAACVTAMKNAVLPAVNLVLMYDKSGSMGLPSEGGNASLKWIPVNAGMKAFFTDPKSGGYNASLQFFPAPGDLNATCGANYATPLVPLTPLSASGPLLAALDAASPQGGTPTLPALKGALSYAQQLTTQRPDETTVVVLVTDGEPGLMVNGQFVAGCADNDIAHVADAAKAGLSASPAVKTYVIGVGPSLDKLNAIAAAGGTSQAFTIPVANPTQTTAELQKAFESIRSQIKLPCTFALPTPPAGQSLDKDRVNVAYTSGAGQVTPLNYSGDCASGAGAGWHYDNLTAPTRIELCPGSCAVAQADANGRLTVAFGCITNGVEK
jgi:hypothetical protein